MARRTTRATSSGPSTRSERAGIEHLRFHDLRHSCLSLLAAQGIPARMAMEIAGHSGIRLTQNVYTHVYDEAKQQAGDVMDRLFAGFEPLKERVIN